MKAKVQVKFYNKKRKLLKESVVKPDDLLTQLKVFMDFDFFWYMELVKCS